MSSVSYPVTLESKQIMAIPMGHMTPQMNLSHPHQHSALLPSSSSSYMVPNDVDVGLEVSSSSGGEALMPMFDSITPFMADVNDEQQLESQLLDLAGTVFNVQASMLQYASAALLAPTISARFHEAAIKRVAQCRRQLSVANKKLVKISSLLAEERKDLYEDTQAPQRLSFTPSVMPRMTSLPISRTPNKRGRARLLKCEKHRRWKKRCPVDCADKPSNAMYGEIDDGDDDQDMEEEEPMEHVMQHPSMSLANMNGMSRPPLHPPPPIQLAAMPPHLVHHPHSHLHMPMGMGGHLGMPMLRPMMPVQK